MYDTPAGRIDEVNDYDLNLVTIAGVDWFKLPEENGVIPIVAKDAVNYMPFNYNTPRDNNFATSEVLSRITTDWLPLIEEALGSDIVIEFGTDLSSVYGETDYGILRSKISLPTWDMYKKHLKAFRKYTTNSKCLWLATPWTTLDQNNVCLISGHVYINAENPRCSYDVHPVLYIKASALTTQN
jgi:hypothetical protein